MRNFVKKQNGITLIALVVTIIVLIILAGVSIAMLVGENGIITKAQQAKEETEQAQKAEQKQLTVLEAATHLTDYKYTDMSGTDINIPAQCAVSKVEGENTLENGLVIIDVNGNEWVWIEVPKSVTETSTTDEEIENALINYAFEYRGDYSDTWYEGCGLTQGEYEKNYSEMLQSIKANGGFYIGKYEVGSFDNPVKSNDTTRKAVIQKGTYPYNYITCSQAQGLSEGLAPNNEITSSLMFGIQWDLILAYLETKGVSESELKTNSGSWGNYREIEFSVEAGNKYIIYSNSVLGEWDDVPANYTKPANNSNGNGILLSTGATKRNMKMNIYDLAGNVYEWTLEKSSNVSTPCVLRGGYYCSLSSDYPASIRNGFSTSGSFFNSGFRPTLY